MEKNTKSDMLDYITARNDVAEVAQHDLQDAVVRAALAGCSWTEIGEKLGLSKQTAFNRYRAKVAMYERLEEENRTGEDAVMQENLLNSLYNPIPYTGFKGERDSKWTRTDTTPPADQENTNGLYECHCGWTIVYPQHEACEAMQDIYEHERMHEDEDDRAARYVPEFAPNGQRIPLPSIEQPAKILDESPAPEMSDIYSGKVNTAGDRLDWIADPKNPRPKNCPYCNAKKHVIKQDQRKFWIYPGCSITKADQEHYDTGITL